MSLETMDFRLLEPVKAEATTVGFVGRAAELTMLDELARRKPAFGVLSGAAGMGKTALALRWAGTRTLSFPDGVVYVDLGGCGGERVTYSVLRRLGLADDRIPDDGQARADLYRATATGRRLLILDNVLEAAHVREVFPADPNVVLLALSRYALPGLVAGDDALEIRLEPLPVDDAKRLLGDSATDELAEFCRRTPLALRLAAGNPGGCGDAGQARVPLWEADEQEAGIRAAFDIAYKGLSPEVAHALRILGSLPLISAHTACAASALGLSEAQAGRTVDSLVCRGFVFKDADGGYRMSDVVRLCALERAGAEEAPARLDAALRRVADWYGGQASRRTKEKENFVALLRALGRMGWHALVARLAASWFEFYERRSLWRDWVEAYTCAWESVRFESDRLAGIRVLSGLGVANRRLGRFQESADAYRQALDIATGIGDELVIGPILAELADLCLAFGRTEQSGQYREAVPAAPRRGRLV
jgi:hypothetical protein